MQPLLTLLLVLNPTEHRIHTVIPTRTLNLLIDSLCESITSETCSFARSIVVFWLDVTVAVARTLESSLLQNHPQRRPPQHLCTL